MNYLTPDEFNSPTRGGVSSGGRRKSFCNSIIWGDTVKSTQPKKSKRERRGSLTEPATTATATSCRRSSIVHRWFKHISEAAEAYKARTKGNHDVAPLEDPATVTLSNSSTKESLEGTPEKDLVSAATPTPVTATSTTNVDTQNHGGDGNDSNLENKSGHNGYRNGDGQSGGKSGTFDEDGANRSSSGNKYRPGDFSNNSNNTRTLTQQSSLVAPSEVHISVSPALTAEPVLTPNERLRRLDESIRFTLGEKQKIVCDMFRVPVEHFSAIADIAGQPEAPKEPSDIVLAAFAQVQSLTETLNDYISISQQQEISAVSTSLCDECHNKSKQARDQRSRLPQNHTQQHVTGGGTERSSNSSNSSTVVTVVRNPSNASDRNDIIADDDGYCEIDEIRLPSIAKVTTSPTSVSSGSSITTASATVSSSSSASLVSTAPTSINSTNSTQTVVTPEMKRQSTISADSIPEETEHDISTEGKHKVSSSPTVTSNEHHIENGDSGEDEASAVVSKILDGNDGGDVSISDAPSGTNPTSEGDEHIEVNDAYDSISQQISEFNADSESIAEQQEKCCSAACGSNRITHIQSISPAVPCHLISTYVTALNSQISQLLPKLNERDIEREKLRKENQHLRDLLNSMHEREIVSTDKETPENGMSASQDPMN